jgi:anaphase-promoting complex subunit 6
MCVSASLRFRESQVWLKGMYRARLHKYDLSIQHPLSLAEVQDDNMDESGSSSQGKRDASSSSSSDAIVRARSLFANSVDAKTIVAEFHYYHNNFAKCHELTQAILEADSHAHACLAYHLSSLVELKSSRELFIDAHRLVDSFPDTAEAWYAVGCYYYLCNKFEKARINFLKATSLNPYFAPAWLGYGHTFAAQDESDQALAAYRTASRFFSGCHLPPLCIGMEYAKTGNLQVSDQFLTHTLSICALDPLVFNEIGVLRYLQGNYEEAAEAFEKVMDLSQAHLVSQTVSETVEASLFNLGHCYRKLQRLNEAVEMYSRALRCKPNKASTYTAMAFTYHLLGNFDAAINYYHKALGICPEDTLTTEMLERALKHAAENSSLA